MSTPASLPAPLATPSARVVYAAKLWTPTVHERNAERITQRAGRQRGGKPPSLWQQLMLKLTVQKVRMSLHAIATFSELDGASNLSLRGIGNALLAPRFGIIHSELILTMPCTYDPAIGAGSCAAPACCGVVRPAHAISFTAGIDGGVIAKESPRMADVSGWNLFEISVSDDEFLRLWVYLTTALCSSYREFNTLLYTCGGGSGDAALTTRVIPDSDSEDDDDDVDAAEDSDSDTSDDGGDQTWRYYIRDPAIYYQSLRARLLPTDIFVMWSSDADRDRCRDMCLVLEEQCAGDAFLRRVATHIGSTPHRAHVELQAIVTILQLGRASVVAGDAGRARDAFMRAKTLADWCGIGAQLLEPSASTHQSANIVVRECVLERDAIEAARRMSLHVTHAILDALAHTVRWDLSIRLPGGAHDKAPTVVSSARPRPPAQPMHRPVRAFSVRDAMNMVPTAGAPGGRGRGRDNGVGSLLAAGSRVACEDSDSDADETAAGEKDTVVTEESKRACDEAAAARIRQREAVARAWATRIRSRDGLFAWLRAKLCEISKLVQRDATDGAFPYDYPPTGWWEDAAKHVLWRQGLTLYKEFTCAEVVTGALLCSVLHESVIPRTASMNAALRAVDVSGHLVSRNCDYYRCVRRHSTVFQL